jgi:putative transposase
VHELRQQFPVVRLLKKVGLAKSSFYYWDNARKAADKFADVKQEIQQIFDQHKGRYGYRRVAAELAARLRYLNPKTVLGLMRELGLQSIQRRKKYQSFKGEVGQAAPNHMNREFSADAPQMKLVTDVTEFKVGNEKLYLSPLIDLYNGEVISFEMNRRPVFDLVTSMLKEALKKLSKDAKPMLHSDQGWHYRMSAYRQMLGERHILQSMSRKANCHDNAAMESFFAILKSEFFNVQKFDSIEQLMQGIRDYIHYYNHDRIKMKLGWLSPVSYRTRHALT